MSYIQNQGIRIHYEIEGQGSPLVLLHGLTGNLNQWRYFGYVEELKKEHRIILVDARGHGKSDKPYSPAAYKPDVMAGDILAIADELNINKAIFFGYSMGAWIGFNGIAKLSLPQFYTFILGGISPYFQESIKPYLLWIKAIMQIGIERGMGKAADEMVKISSPQTEQWKSDILAIDPNAMVALIQAMLEYAIDFQGILPSMNMPILIYCGEADPFFQEAKNSAKIMKNATFLTLHGLSHTGALMRSDLILPHVKRFLSEVTK